MQVLHLRLESRLRYNALDIDRIPLISPLNEECTNMVVQVSLSYIDRIPLIFLYRNEECTNMVVQVSLPSGWPEDYLEPCIFLISEVRITIVLKSLKYLIIE
jgi:hypothetical protein